MKPKSFEKSWLQSNDVVQCFTITFFFFCIFHHYFTIFTIIVIVQLPYVIYVVTNWKSRTRCISQNGPFLCLFNNSITIWYAHLFPKRYDEFCALRLLLYFGNILAATMPLLFFYAYTDNSYTTASTVTAHWTPVCLPTNIIVCTILSRQKFSHLCVLTIFHRYQSNLLSD